MGWLAVCGLGFSVSSDHRHLVNAKSICVETFTANVDVLQVNNVIATYFGLLKL